MTTRTWWSALGIVALAVSLGCSKTEETRTCQPGAVQHCACRGLPDGVQTCSDDGSRWGACACGEPDAGPNAGAGPARADDQKAEAARAAREKELQSDRDRLLQLQDQLASNRRALAEADRKINELMEQIAAAQGNAEAMAGLQDQLRRVQEERRRIEEQVGPPPRDRIMDNFNHPRPAGTLKCTHEGTPLEECFLCPGDPRC